MIKRLIAGVALGAFFLWLALRNVHFSEIAATLRNVSLTAFALFVLMHLAVMFVRAARWAVLVRPLARVPVSRMLSPLAIGFMINFILPGRAGEIVRAWLFSKREQVSTSATFGTIVVERLFDGLAIVCYLAPAPFVLTAGDPLLLRRIRWAAAGLPVAYVAVFVLLILLSHHREILTAFLSQHPAVQRRPLLTRAVRLIERFCEGLDSLRSWRTVAWTVLFSVLIWGWAVLANLLMIRAIGLHLPWYAPVFLLVLQGVGVLVPSPGFVGPFQYAHVVALGVYKVPEVVALSLALLIHAGIFIAVLAPGFWFAAREHLGLRELTRASRTSQ